MALREKMEGWDLRVSGNCCPSENTLVKSLTVQGIPSAGPSGSWRRKDTQSIHGKGVRIIYQPGQQQSEFILGGIESLKEAVARNREELYHQGGLFRGADRG